VFLFSDPKEKRPAAGNAIQAKGFQRRLRWPLADAEANTPREEDTLRPSLEEQSQG
jgi:hypothetical protein